ncbi:hypothetical protein F2Q68_00041137 [Brassica cretica]|uniref:Uncharacterized protein n=1 Tax=Brassica cretica TaxID=69181 RepID=A0A8S9MMW4_BRACR|nr:hypothetical protein F2Q68_00041137 [Brassica cretica]
MFLLLRRPASLVGARRGPLLSGESFVVCVWVHRAHLFLGFWLLEGPLLWSCQVEPSQVFAQGLTQWFKLCIPAASFIIQSPLRQFRSLALLTVVSCPFGSGSSKWFLSSPGGLVFLLWFQLSGGLVWVWMGSPCVFLVLLSLMLASGFVLAFSKRAFKVTGSTIDYV